MQPLTRQQIAWRVAQGLPDGLLVDFGLGLPVMVTDHVPPGRDLLFQSENGVIGAGPEAAGDAIDPDLVDAGSRRITLPPGASIEESSASFAMTRGGHGNVTILGAFDVGPAGFTVREMAPGLTRDELQAHSGARQRYAADCAELAAPALAA